MKISDLLHEGINDKHIFKAILVAGSPGAGKSTVSKKLLSHYGFRTVDIDKFIELLGKKENLDFKNMSDWDDKIFDKSSYLRDIKMDLYIQGRLPLIIDGTGRNYNRITSTAEVLKKKYGYDVGLLFVNVPLDIAKERNIQRGGAGGRSVDEEFLIKAWRDTQNNIGKFQDYFGSDMFIVDNGRNPDFTKASKRIDKFINEPVENHLAKHWISSEKDRLGIR